jgi:ribonuclease HI
MESHNHPAYEDTFQRIATILDVPADDQVKQERALTRVTEALAQLAERSVEWAKRSAESEAELNAKFKELAERSAETDDKLNALIDLMDRHQREHDRDRPK